MSLHRESGQGLGGNNNDRGCFIFDQLNFELVLSQQNKRPSVLMTGAWWWRMTRMTSWWCTISSYQYWASTSMKRCSLKDISCLSQLWNFWFQVKDISLRIRKIFKDLDKVEKALGKQNSTDNLDMDSIFGDQSFSINNSMKGFLRGKHKNINIFFSWLNFHLNRREDEIWPRRAITGFY